MDVRLDPGCGEARSLEERQRAQRLLLVGGEESQLSEVVRRTHDRQVLAHIGACARCSSYKRSRCDACGFDTRYERHGWRCANGNPTWREWLPWNWRPKQAPPGARPEPAAQPSRAPSPPPSAPHPPPSRAAQPQRVPYRRAVSPPAAKPAPSPLAHAYAVLGVTSAASTQEVRAAYRERAQQYHPDKVAHMAPEFREIAETKMKEINDAYERIKRVL